MIAHGPQLIRPPRKRLIVLSLVLSLLWVISPLAFGLSHPLWWPDLVLMTLLYWQIHQPSRVSLWVAFLLGLMVDVESSTLLGFHALTYTLSMVAVDFVRRRLRSFQPTAQMPQLIIFWVLAAISEFALQALNGLTLTDYGLLLRPWLEALLWIPLSLVLMAAQRRSSMRHSGHR